MALVLSVFHDSISKTRGEKSGGKTGKTVGKTVGKTGGLIMTLHKQNGVIRDILESRWRDLVSILHQSHS